MIKAEGQLFGAVAIRSKKFKAGIIEVGCASNRIGKAPESVNRLILRKRRKLAALVAVYAVGIYVRAVVVLKGIYRIGPLTVIVRSPRRLVVFELSRAEVRYFCRGKVIGRDGAAICDICIRHVPKPNICLRDIIPRRIV